MLSSELERRTATGVSAAISPITWLTFTVSYLTVFFKVVSKLAKAHAARRDQKLRLDDYFICAALVGSLR